MKKLEKEITKKNYKTLIGVENEWYITTIPQGCYDEYTWVKALCVRNVLYFADGTSLSVWMDEGICPSGWQTCTYGCWKWGDKKPHSWMKKVRDGEMEVSLKEDSVELIMRNAETGRKILKVSSYGGDQYYPCGGVSLDSRIFRG